MNIPHNAPNSAHDDALLAQDAAARQRALEVASFIVEAPAGAGKTELLSQRYLRLLATVAHPEEIIAITFTNKAAAEMRVRILKSLQAAASGVRPSEAHRQVTFDLANAALAHGAAQGWQLIEQPSRLRITTIDALCAQLARQMPLLSRMGAQPTVTDDAQPLYEAAAKLAVEQLEARSPAIADTVAASLRYLDNDANQLVRLLAAMLARRDQWLSRTGQLGPDSAQALQDLLELELATALSAVDGPVQAALRPLARYAAANAPEALDPLADWDGPLTADYAELPRWQALCDLLLTSTGGLRKALNKNNGFPAGKEGAAQKKAMEELLADLASRPEAEQRLQRLRRLPRLDGREDEAAIVAAFENLLRLAAAGLLTVFQQQREIDFIEVAQRALLALGDEGDAGDDGAPSDLALRLDYQISHLLVDEFQDTSPTQMRLLTRLTAGWEENDGRTLFCVGDPMQSIYRFRKADVGLFLAAIRDGIGHVRLEPLALSRNNRSCPPAVRWINEVFKDVFPPADHVPRGAIRYRPFVATRADQPGAGVSLHPLVLTSDVEEDDARQVEAARILDLVDATWAEHRERDIAVLVRARTHLSELIAEIRRRRPDLRFQAVEVEPLGGRQWVQDLLILTRALLQLADRVNWLALLRAPWCGLTLADLHALAADAPERTVWTLLEDEERLARLSADGQQRLRHTRAVLAEALAHRGRQPLARWLEGAWLLLGGVATLPDATALQDARAFFDLVAREEAGGDFGLDRLAQEVDKLYAAPDPHADGRLKFMTIHKSKGLEFDTVILPALHRPVQDRDQPLLLWEEVAAGTASRLIVAPLPQKKGRSGDPSPYSFLQLLEQERRRNEDIRVLYVGATRTIRALHLLGSARFDDKKGELKAPPENTPLGILWPLVERRFAETPVLATAQLGTPTGADLAAFVPQLLRLRDPRASAPWDVAAEPVAEADTTPTAALVLDLRPATEAAIGTLTHRYLELLADSDLAAWSKDRIDALRPAMEGWLHGNGLAGAAAREAAADVAAMLHTVLASDAGRWALAPRPAAAAEYALLRRGEGGTDSGPEVHVLDRTFVDDGTRWIVDYKSSRLPGTPTPALLARQAEEFRGQLERYAALFADEGRPVRYGVLFTRYGQFVELPRLPLPTQLS